MMEILAVIGILAIIAIVFTGGGLLGWVLKAIGEIIGFLSDGCGSCLQVFFWIFIVLLALLVLFL
jgi:hypothetical protein